MNPKCSEQYLVWRTWDDGTCGFVSRLPGKSGKDWGYDERGEALLLSKYWLKRFMKDAQKGAVRGVGSVRI